MAQSVKIEERTLAFIAYVDNKRATGDFPANIRLAEIMGMNSKSTVSEIMAKRQNIQPEQWKKFRNYFKIKDNPEGSDNSVPRETHTEKLIRVLEERLSEEKRILEKHNQFLQELVKSNLSGLSQGQAFGQAQLKAILGLSVEMASNGDKKKANALHDRIDKQIVEDFEAGAKSGIPAVDGR